MEKWDRTSDLPKLKVRVLKNVSKQKEESKQGQGFRMTRHSYLTDSGEIAGITIWRFVLDSNTEWRSSNEQLVRQTGAIPLDPIPTIYSTLGNYFGWICAILFLTCLTLGVVIRVRRR